MNGDANTIVAKGIYSKGRSASSAGSQPFATCGSKSEAVAFFLTVSKMGFLSVRRVAFTFRVASVPPSMASNTSTYGTLSYLL